jgi:hypothetical protein
MKKEELVKQLNDNNVEWSDTGIIENYPYRRLNIQLKKQPEYILILTINEDNNDIIYFLFKDRQPIISGVSDNQNILNIILEYINKL